MTIEPRTAEILIGLLLAAYAFIFKLYSDRLLALEAKPVCDAKACVVKFDKIEAEQAATQPILLEIREKLVSIETFLQLLQDGKLNINK